MNKKFLGALTLPFFLGCVAPTTSTSSSSQSGTSVSNRSLACLSVSASVIGLSDTDVHCSGNGSVHGSVVLLGSSTLRLDGNAEVSDQVYSRSEDSISEHGHCSSG